MMIVDINSIPKKKKNSNIIKSRWLDKVLVIKNDNTKKKKKKEEEKKI